jgi:Domain of unknown function (DUF4340)
MSRSAWLNALLAAAVAALGAWVYLKPSGDAAANQPLSALKFAEARSVRVERGASPLYTLEKQQESWRLTAPFAARADEFRVRQLLEFLEGWAASRLAATDLAQFELAPPALRVTVNDQSFGFGMISPITREQYVLAGNAVYVVNPRYGAQIPANAVDLASKQLFTPDEAPLRFELKQFMVEQRDGKWTQTPAASDLSQDDFVRWAEAWRGAAALRVEPHSGRKPLETIQVQLKDGTALALGLLAREPELVLGRPDEKLQYHFRADAAKHLLSPPSAHGEPAAKK